MRASDVDDWSGGETLRAGPPDGREASAEEEEAAAAAWVVQVVRAVAVVAVALHGTDVRSLRSATGEVI